MGTPLLSIACIFASVALQPAHAFGASPSQMKQRPSIRSATASTGLKAVNFRYSASALDHLALLDDERPKTEDDSMATEPVKNDAKSTATLGALGAMALTVAIFQFAIIPAATISSEYVDGLSLFSAAASAIAGYKLLGGDEARTANLPKDGGYDAKFVVDKPGRIRDITGRIEKEEGCILVVSEGKSRDLTDAMRLINEVHGEEYIAEFQAAVNDARETGRIRRLHPVVMRTLIDEHSYDAAVAGVADWIDSVDAVLRSKSNNEEISFALTRPPSHHACIARGMGGCLLNGPAIAAFRALELGAEQVAILDIDAHHGNGIANCIQNEPRIRYCSIHEEVIEKNWFKSEKDIEKKEKSVDPRSPFLEDTGPLRNICNIPLPKGTIWSGEEGYREALVEQALPFLTGKDSSLTQMLILAAGFDALEVDATSGLKLETEDFREIGNILHDAFGNRIAIGLEGGYVYGKLGEAVVQLVNPWREE